MDTYSAYRSWTENGIGNGPDDPSSGAGHQYLHVDAPLWNEADLPHELRPWLSASFEADHPILGDELESWLCFSIREWHFVARLRAFGKDVYGRVNYHTHGRGWRDSEWTNPEDDPGAWLGDESSFDPPWKDALRSLPVSPRLPRERSADWKDLVADERQFATTLLACLFQRFEGYHRRPVVCLAPLDDFKAGGRLASLIGFARAALPFEFKKRAKVRIYADNAQKALEQGFHLLALVDNDENRSLLGRSDTIIDRSGNVLSGMPLKWKHSAYAEGVVSRSAFSSEAVLRFSSVAKDRLGRYLEQGNDEKALKTAVTIVYDLSLAALHPGSYDSLFRQRLFPQSQKRTGELKWLWSDLIPESDWEQLTMPALIELALSPAPTPESERLREYVRCEMRRRGGSLDAAIPVWWAADAGHARQMLELGTSRPPLASDSLVKSLVSQLAPSAVADVLADPKFGPSLLKFFGGPDSLPEHWKASELLQPKDAAKISQMFQTVADVPSSRIVWRAYMDEWAQAMAKEPNLPELGLGKCLAGLGPPEMSRELDVILAYGDLYTRFPEAESFATFVMRKLMSETVDDSKRRRIARECIAGKSPFLTQYLPTRWLLQAIGDEAPEGLYRLLDSRLHSDRTSEETTALREVGWWLRWRRGSAVLNPSVATSVTAWRRAIYASAWLPIEHPSPSLEEWKQVITDLNERLTQVAKIPWIRGYEEEQLTDLINAAVNFGALADIAELKNPPDYQGVQRQSRLMDGMSDGALALLSFSASDAIELSYPQACTLLERCGWRLKPALWHYIRAWTIVLCTDKNAAVRDLQKLRASSPLSDKPQLLSNTLADWIVQRVEIAISNRTLGDRLDEIVPILCQADRQPVRQQAADQLKTAGLRNIANFVFFGTSPDLLYQNTAEDLCAGRTQGLDWEELIREAKAAGPNQKHPLCKLAEALDSLSAEKQRQLETNGWDAFWELLAREPRLIDIPPGYQGPLPAFLVLAKIRDNVSLGALAESLIGMRRRPPSLGKDWIRSVINGIYSVDSRRRSPKGAQAAVGRLMRVAQLSGWCEVTSVLAELADPTRARMMK